MAFGFLLFFLKKSSVAKYPPPNTFVSSPGDRGTKKSFTFNFEPEYHLL